VAGLTKPQFQNFDEVFRQNLFRSLVSENLPQKQIEIFLDDIRKIEITKTNNRSVLGSMNDLAFQLKYQIVDEGGLLDADISKLNHDLNRIPMSAIKEIYSIYELQNLLNKMSR
jgi:CRISPR/Cas system CSM-associated protein Csm2 small subunit